MAGMIGSNEVAHTLAKSAYDNRLSCNWVDEPPNFLINALSNNVTIMPNE